MSNVSPALTVRSWVGSLGSGNGLGVSAVARRVGVGVNDDSAQPLSRIAAIRKAYIRFIIISTRKYT
jgi:hypothetical protein